MSARECTKCGLSKPLTEYGRAKGYADGHYRQCKICRNAMIARWSAANRDRKTVTDLAWNQANLERRREIRRNSARARRPYRSPLQKVHDALRTKIWRQLRATKNRQATVYLVGYSLGELKDRIEAQFKPGMSWENYGDWHIDHIKPKAKFIITGPDDPQLKECWALSNLQPLWAKENLQKQSKWTAN